MIDWDRVSELRDEVGRDGLEEILAMFFEEVETVLARLQSAPDPVTLAADMHFLKGSAHNLGFAALGHLCEDGEQAAASGQPGRVDIAELVRCYDRSKADFLRLLRTR